MNNALELLTLNLFSQADSNPSLPALIVHNGSHFSAHDLYQRAIQFAHLLRGRQVQSGERVAVFLEKSFDCAAAIFAIWMADAAVVPIFPGLKTRQVKHILRDSGSKIVFSNRALSQSVDSQTFTATELILCEQVESNLRPQLDFARRQFESEKLAAIFYTSGSTGPAKGVAVSHANLIAGTRIVCTYLELTPEDRILSVLPWSFDYGFNQLLSAVYTQCSLVIPNHVLPGDICQALNDYRITGLAGVPPFWQQLANEKSAFMQNRFPNLRYLTNSGGALHPTIVKRLHERQPHTKIYLMYGLTEAFRSTYLSPELILGRPNSMGRPIPETEIMILNQEGRVCGPGEVGELVHAGPTVALGYWNNTEATHLRFKPHPLRPESGERVVFSGDLVTSDGEGFLYFVGRNDEMIKSRGHRVSPTEVEMVVLESNLVQEVVVKSEIQSSGDHEIVAYCVPKKPDLFSTAALLSYCRAQLPHYMTPQNVVVCVSLPRTSSGKLDRKPCQELL